MDLIGSRFGRELVNAVNPFPDGLWTFFEHFDSYKVLGRVLDSI